MRKFLAIILVCLIAFSFSACGVEKKLEYGKEYAYTNITFDRNPSITFEDISVSLIPIGLAQLGARPKNIIEYENFVRNNLDKYNLTKLLEGGDRVIISFNIPCEAIIINETSITVKVAGQSNTQEMVFENNELKLNEFSSIRYKNGVVYYSIELMEGYEIHYNYK